jgi:hypothetical protein
MKNITYKDTDDRLERFERKIFRRKSLVELTKVIIFLSIIIRRVEQAQKFNFWTSIFEKISKILENFGFFGLFQPFRPFSTSKLCKVVEQKLFLTSVRIFQDHSSSKLLRISISLHPNA